MNKIAFSKPYYHYYQKKRMIIMILKEKERTVIQDLQTQEKAALKNTENTHSRPGIRS